MIDLVQEKIVDWIKHFEFDDSQLPTPADVSARLDCDDNRDHILSPLP
jgi:hypothetical protein